VVSFVSLLSGCPDSLRRPTAGQRKPFPAYCICDHLLSLSFLLGEKRERNDASYSQGYLPRLQFSYKKRNVHGKLNASWKISSLAVNGQSFLVSAGHFQ